MIKIYHPNEAICLVGPELVVGSGFFVLGLNDE